jgi:hypothetical protein
VSWNTIHLMLPNDTVSLFQPLMSSSPQCKSDSDRGQRSLPGGRRSWRRKGGRSLGVRVLTPLRLSHGWTRKARRYSGSTWWNSIRIFGPATLTLLLIAVMMSSSSLVRSTRLAIVSARTGWDSMTYGSSSEYNSESPHLPEQAGATAGGGRPWTRWRQDPFLVDRVQMMCSGKDNGVLVLSEESPELLADYSEIEHLDFGITVNDALNWAEDTGQHTWIAGALEEAADRNSTAANTFIRAVGEVIAEGGALGLRTVEMAAGLKLAIDYYRTAGDSVGYDEVMMP